MNTSDTSTYSYEIIEEIYKSKEYYTGYLVSKYGHTEEHAEDIFQEAIVQALDWGYFDKYDKKYKLKTWFTRYIIWTSSKMEDKRKLKMVDKYDEVSRLISSGITPLCDLITKEEEIIIEKSINSLSEKLQKVAIRVVEGKSYPEISKELGIREDSCMSRCHRARVKLREMAGKSELKCISKNVLWVSSR